MKEITDSPGLFNALFLKPRWQDQKTDGNLDVSDEQGLKNLMEAVSSVSKEQSKLRQPTCWCRVCESFSLRVSSLSDSNELGYKLQVLQGTLGKMSVNSSLTCLCFTVTSRWILTWTDHMTLNVTIGRASMRKTCFVTLLQYGSILTRREKAHLLFGTCAHFVKLFPRLFEDLPW